MTLGMGARFIARKDLELPRRSLLKGLAGIFAVAVAPAIIRTPGLIMPIKPSFAPMPLFQAWNLHHWQHHTPTEFEVWAHKMGLEIAKLHALERGYEIHPRLST